MNVASLMPRRVSRIARGSPEVKDSKHRQGLAAEKDACSCSQILSRDAHLTAPRRPYSRFHASYLKRYLDTGVPHIVGAEIGRTVLGLHKDGTEFEFFMQVQEIAEEGSKRSATPADTCGHPVVCPWRKERASLRTVSTLSAL